MISSGGLSLRDYFLPLKTPIVVCLTTVYPKGGENWLMYSSLHQTGPQGTQRSQPQRLFLHLRISAG